MKFGSHLIPFRNGDEAKNNIKEIFLRKCFFSGPATAISRLACWPTLAGSVMRLRDYLQKYSARKILGEETLVYKQPAKCNKIDKFCKLNSFYKTSEQVHST